jgi:hypothetical protein
MYGVTSECSVCTDTEQVMLLSLYHKTMYHNGGIATRYGLDGPGIESRWGARFSAPVQTGPGAHSASHTMGTGSFPRVKRPGRDVDHPPPYSAEVKERVELYLYSPLGHRGTFQCEFYLFTFYIPQQSLCATYTATCSDTVLSPSHSLQPMSC